MINSVNENSRYNNLSTTEKDIMIEDATEVLIALMRDEHGKYLRKHSRKT